MDKQSNHFLPIVLVAVRFFCAVYSENIQQPSTDEFGNTYTLDITANKFEEQINVRNENGTQVLKVELYGKKGYQIDKPTNENACLLRQLFEKGKDEVDNNCYMREPVDKSNLTKDILDHCEGRDIFALIPDEQGCEEVKQDIQKAKQNGNSESVVARHRRHGCIWTYRIHLHCWSINECCRTFFGFCSQYCYSYFCTWVGEYLLYC